MKLIVACSVLLDDDADVEIMEHLHKTKYLAGDKTQVEGEIQVMHRDPRNFGMQTHIPVAVIDVRDIAEVRSALDKFKKEITIAYKQSSVGSVIVTHPPHIRNLGVFE